MTLNDSFLEKFHGTANTNQGKDDYDEHFWRGYRSFGWGLRPGCGCGYCTYGWETARDAFGKVAKRYGEGELKSRQLDLFK